MRLKKDIAIIPNALERICDLRGVNFKWKDGRENLLNMGLIGQEVEKVFPELVRTDSEGIKYIQYSALAGALIEAVKDQQKGIKEQNKRIEELAKEIELLKTKIK